MGGGWLSHAARAHKQKQGLRPRCGCRNISFLGSGLLLLNYVGAVALALRMPAAFNARLMIPAHALLGLMLVYKTIKLDAAG